MAIAEYVDNEGSKYDRLERGGYSDSSATPLKRYEQHRVSFVDTEGEITYPKDEPDKEMSECARIWKIYLYETAKFDSSLMEGCNRGIDVLLVFTGLFSAVLTTFIIQSCEIMISNSDEDRDRLLSRIIELLAVVAEESPNPVKLSPSITWPETTWVNGLWFAALSFSLSTALISMLAKQWLQTYSQIISGPPRHQARQRQLRYMRFEQWHVLAIVNALPLLLHIALFLFFAGQLVLLSSAAPIALTLTTAIIVACAYLFYFTSICLPFFYPDCPYQLSISAHLRRWLSPAIPDPDDYASFANPQEGLSRYNRSALVPDDKLDANCLVWLLTRSMDKYIVSTTIQAIAGLPHDFTGVQILRDAGALYHVESEFKACFEQDDDISLQWHLIDPDRAWLCCRAWMNLTRGTSKKWPPELTDPLLKLRDLKFNPDAAAVASCVIAHSTLQPFHSQWEILTHLSGYITGEVRLTHVTVCWLLRTIVEWNIKWELPVTTIEATRIKAVPIILQLLHRTIDSPLSRVRRDAAFALHFLTCGLVDRSIRPDEKCMAGYCCDMMAMALSTIITNPIRFGVHDSLLSIAAKDLASLVSPILTQPQRFSAISKDAARSSLFESFISGWIRVGVVPENIVADVLQFLYQPEINTARPAYLAKSLVDNLRSTSHERTVIWSMKLLHSLMQKPSFEVVQGFTGDNGIGIILYFLRAGDARDNFLQLEAWRLLCKFIDGIALICAPHHTIPPELEYQLDLIFGSDFLELLCIAVRLQHWWLSVLCENTKAAVLQLCRLRPDSPAWLPRIKNIRDFLDGSSTSKDGVMRAFLIQIEEIVQSSHRHASDGGK